MVFYLLIAKFFVIRNKYYMAHKTLKSKRLYTIFLCKRMILSTCPVRGNISTARSLVAV